MNGRWRVKSVKKETVREKEEKKKREENERNKQRMKARKIPDE